MFKWKKLGRIFNPQDVKGRSWLDEFAQAPSALIFNEFVRVYFSCRPKPDENGQYISYSAFIDLDRKNLFKIINLCQEPVLKLGALGTFDEFGTYPISVIRNGHEILAYYGGWTRCESVPFNVAIGFAKSHDDGVTFNRIGNGPILSYSTDEPFVLSGPKIRKFNQIFYLFYIAGRRWIMAERKPEPIYKIRLAYSHNGLDWIKLNKDLVENSLSADEAQASPDVFFYNNMYHMFFCYRQPFDFRKNKDRSYRLGYARSLDLINWTRDDSIVDINVSKEGWDSEMIAYPHVFELAGELYMFYLGNEVGRYGFGLAQLANDK